MSRASEEIVLGSLGQSHRKQNFVSDLKKKLFELYRIHKKMLVSFNGKDFKLENLLKCKEFNVKFHFQLPSQPPIQFIAIWFIRKICLMYCVWVYKSKPILPVEGGQGFILVGEARH